MEQGIFDIDGVFASLAAKARANGDMLSVREMTQIPDLRNADDSDIKELLILLSEENIGFYADIDPLDNDRIKRLDEKIKNSCDEEKTAAAGKENPVRLYLSEISGIPILDPVRERDLLFEIQDGSEDAVNELIERTLFLPVYIAEKYIGRGMLFLDLVQEGNLVLMTAAAESPDPRISFPAFCVWKLDRKMTELTAEKEEIVKVPPSMAEDMGKVIKEYQRLSEINGEKPSVQEISGNLELPADRVKEILSFFDKKTLQNDSQEKTETFADSTDITDHQISQQVNTMLSALPENETKVIAMKFGLAGNKEMTITEIAGKLGITEDEVGKLVSQAMKHLGGQK